MSSLQYSLWVLYPALQVCLATVMVRRGLHRRYPMFFAYTVYQVTVFALRFVLYHAPNSYKLYFLAYWSTSALGVVLGFLVIHEVFQHVFRPYDALREMGEVLFRWAALVLILVAVVTAASAGGGVGLTPLMNTIVALERSVRMMQCGLVLLMVLFSTHVGLSARNHIFGIALGFGIYASVELTMFTVRSRFGPGADVALDIIKSAAYNIAVITWVSYLLFPEPERRLVRPVVEKADQWNFAVLGVTNPGANSPSLPMIENAVERILQRANGKEEHGKSKA